MSIATNNMKSVKENNDSLIWATIIAPSAVMLALSPFNLDHFGLPKLTVLYLATLLLLYLQFRRWLEAGRINISYSPVNILAGFIVLIAIIAMFFSPSPLASLFGRFSRHESLLVFVCSATILYFASGAARREGFKNRFETVFVLSFAIICLYGLLELFNLDLLRLKGQVGGRISSTFGNPVFFGAYLAMALPILVAKVLESKHMQQPQYARMARLSLIFLGVLLLFLTLSRGAWIGTAAALLVVFWLSRKHGRRRFEEKRRSKYLVASCLVGVVALLVLLMALTFNSPQITKAAGSPASLENRVEMWKSASYMIKDRPLTGYGLDQTRDWFNEYTTFELGKLENDLHERAHNIYLQSFIDGGALFLLGQLWLFFYALFRGFRAARDGNYLAVGFTGAIVGYLVQGITGVAMNELTILLWFIIGATVSLDPRENVRSFGFALPTGFAAKKMVALSFLVLAVIVSLPLFIEGRYNQVARQAKATMDENALAQAQLASKYLVLDPYYQWHTAHLYLQFAQSKQDASYAKEAAKIAKRALRYSPHSPELLYMVGSAHLLMGQYAKDKHALRQARHYLSLAKRKAPLFIKIQEELLLLELQRQDYSGVKQTAEHILLIDGSNAMARSAQSVALDKTKNKN